MSLDEYVKILATWYHETNSKQYGCKSQIEKMKRGPNPELRIENLKTRNGCGRIVKEPRKVHGSIKFHNCYCDHLHESFDYLLFLNNQWARGILPFSGSLTDQPNHWLELMNVIDRLRAEHEITVQKERERVRK